jgi:hypothetical protein
VALLALNVALQTISLAFSIGVNFRDGIIAHALRLAFALYTLGYSIIAIRQKDYRSHTLGAVQLTSLTVIAFALLFIIAILPSSKLDVSSARSESHIKVLDGLNWAVVVLYGLAASLAISMPLGPALHFPPERIYSEKTVSAITNKELENVSGMSGT